MRYRIMMGITVEAGGERQAYDQAKKLEELLKGPLVKMAVMGEGIQLSGDGRPVVHHPQRE